MVRILHAADFHLDSAFTSLPEEKARERRQEGRALPERLVDYANDHGVELLLLAGDLFDSDQLYAQTARELSAALGRFRGQVVIAPGNHDVYTAASPYATEPWPENVHIFRSNTMETLSFPQYGCTVYGAALTGESSDEVCLPFTCPDDGAVHLGVLHGETGARESKYRPLLPDWIARTGLDYLALGHVHTCGGVSRAGATSYAYPGCPEGRGFDETGAKGFLLGTVDRGAAQLAFVPFARRRYEVLEVDVTDRDPAEAVAAALPAATERDIYRIILTGTTGAPVRTEQLSAQLAERFYHLELRDRTGMKRDLWEGCDSSSLRGLFLQKLRAQYDAADEADRRRIEQAVRFGLAAMDRTE